MGETTRIEGVADLVRQLQALGKATGKNTLKRTGTKMLEPMRDQAKATARRRFGDLADSIKIGTRLARSQRGASAVHMEGGAFRSDPKNTVDLHMGPGQQPQGITEEFGTFKQAPHAFMRPAFDAHAGAAIRQAGPLLWTEISKATARRAKKLAKAAKA